VFGAKAPRIEPVNVLYIGMRWYPFDSKLSRTKLPANRSTGLRARGKHQVIKPMDRLHPPKHFSAVL
jgi:hypothetical protein